MCHRPGIGISKLNPAVSESCQHVCIFPGLFISTCQDSIFKMKRPAAAALTVPDPGCKRQGRSGKKSCNASDGSLDDPGTASSPIRAIRRARTVINCIVQHWCAMTLQADHAKHFCRKRESHSRMLVGHHDRLLVAVKLYVYIEGSVIDLFMWQVWQVGWIR